MPTKKDERKPATEGMNALDSYENWLEKQPVRRVKARAGFVSAEETEAGP